MYEKTGILPLRAIAAAFVKLLRKTTARLKISKRHLLYMLWEIGWDAVSVIVNRYLFPICKCTTIELCHAI